MVKIVERERMTLKISVNLYSKSLDTVQPLDSLKSIPSFIFFLYKLLVEYGQIVKILGSGHMEVQCFDGEKRIAHIRGKMRKKVPRLLNLFNYLFWFLVGLDGCW